MEDALSVEVVVCVVVVCVVEVESGAVAWLGEEGEVDCELAPGAAGCVVLGELGVVCATAHTVDSSRIAVIRYTFLICVLLILPACRRLRPFK